MPFVPGNNTLNIVEILSYTSKYPAYKLHNIEDNSWKGAHQILPEMCAATFHPVLVKVEQQLLQSRTAQCPSRTAGFSPAADIKRFMSECCALCCEVSFVTQNV